MKGFGWCCKGITSTKNSKIFPIPESELDSRSKIISESELDSRSKIISESELDSRSTRTRFPFKNNIRIGIRFPFTPTR